MKDGERGRGRGSLYEGSPLSLATLDSSPGGRAKCGELGIFTQKISTTRGCGWYSFVFVLLLYNRYVPGADYSARAAAIRA